MYRNIKKNLTSLIAALTVLAVAFFTAGIEYRSNVDRQKQALADELAVVKNNWEEGIATRVQGLKGLVSYVRLNPHLSQEEYEVFARELLESRNHLLRSLVLMTDTTITHVYPYESNQHLLGTDMGVVATQQEMVLYTKNTGRSVLIAPVELLQGGMGIVVRNPLIVDGRYWGQTAAVFDYYDVLRNTGMLNLARDNQVQVIIARPLSLETETMWTNAQESLDRQDKETPLLVSLQLYDTTMRIYALPKGGWNGFSPLVQGILFSGLALAVAVFFALRHMISVKNQLQENQMVISEANRRLQSTNDELEATIQQLMASEEELKEQYQEIRKQERTIQFMAERDPLTELYNRRKMVEVMEGILDSGAQGAMLLLDIDNFKIINDSQGHVYGDRMLRQVADVLRGMTAKEDWRAFRLGGDEFVLCYQGEVEMPQLEDTIRELCTTLRNSMRVEPMMNHVTVSIGVVRFPLDGTKLDELMIRSDIAMYTAKRSGKDRFQFFREELIQEFEKKIYVERLLRKSLEEGRFYLVYQPVVSAETGELQYFEALLRIKGNVLAPVDFNPVAEDSGLIIPIGEWVIQQAVAQLRTWQEMGLELKPVAINISPNQVRDKSFADCLQRQLEKTRIPPEMIEVEITENVFLEGIEDNIRILRTLRDRGVSIALDDFGTGYSSLNYLTYLPVNKIKLDKIMKDRIVTSGKSNALKSLIELTHGLDMKMVAEGIEQEEEGRLLAAQGCDFLSCQDICYTFEKYSDTT